MRVIHFSITENNMMEIGTLLYELIDNVAVVTINRPERMNTLGGTLKQDLATVFFDNIRNDNAARCVLLTGMGERAFCAGADIKERSASTLTMYEYHVQQRRTHELFSGIENFEKPVIAALNGVALGGGLELALCCDMRIAAEHARLGLPEVKLGVIPAAGGTQRLARLIGMGKAKELIYTSRLIDAYEASQIGLVNQVSPAAKLRESAMALAQKIASQPPLAVRLAKDAINLGGQVDLESALQFERYAAAMLVESDDKAEGMRAFIEKRQPKFKGR